jgi:hypothetical protein
MLQTYKKIILFKNCVFPDKNLLQQKRTSKTNFKKITKILFLPKFEKIPERKIKIEVK